MKENDPSEGPFKAHNTEARAAQAKAERWEADSSVDPRGTSEGLWTVFYLHRAGKLLEDI